jgi:predicted dehydrogenase
MNAEPVSVQAFQRFKASAGVDATLVGLMKFPDEHGGDGRLAYMATGMEEPFRACCEIIGTQGRMEIPGLFGGSLVKVTIGGEEKTHQFERVNRFRLQIEHFSDCVLHGTPLRMPPEDALANTKVLVALKKAAQTGKVTAV